MTDNKTNTAITNFAIPDDLLLRFARLAWGYRLELLPAVPTLFVLALAPGPWWVPWLAALGAGSACAHLLLTPGRLSRAASRREASSFRYSLVEILGHLGLPPGSIRSLQRVPNGYHVRILLPMGTTPDAVVHNTDAIAAGLRARSVSAEVSAADGALIYLTCAMGEDPLAKPLDTPWPGLVGSPSVVAGSVPVGITADGEVVSMTLWSRHVLAAGLPRSGKSVFLTALLAYAMADPTCQVVILDPKGRDFRWAAARCHLASSQEAAAVVLRSLVAEMGRRNQAQLGRKADGVSPGHRPIIVFADELAEITSLGVERRLDDECSNLLRRLAAVGPSAGISLVVATQRPSADLVPTSLRSLFSWLVCMRVQRPADASIILGDLQPGVEPHRIPGNPSWAGVGYITTATGACVKFRGWYLSDDEIIAGDPETGAEGLGPLIAWTVDAHRAALIAGEADALQLEAADEPSVDIGPPPKRRRRQQ